MSPGEESSHHLQDSLENILEEKEGGRRRDMEFHENRGRNVTLMEGNCSARRGDSYNQGIVVSTSPLDRDKLFQVRIFLGIKNWSVFLQTKHFRFAS